MSAVLEKPRRRTILYPDPEPVEQVRFEDWLADWKWLQGDHMTVVAPTKGGKTTLIGHLLPRRRDVFGVFTKPDDEVVRRIINGQKFKRIREWPPPADTDRVALWPDLRKREVIDRLPRIVSPALRGVYEQGGWGVYIDELLYLIRTLKLERDMTPLWEQGRTQYITTIVGSQRPAWVPLSAYSQARHLFLGPTGDKKDLDRMRDISARADVERIQNTLPALKQHEWLYVDAHQGTLVRLTPPPKL